MAASGASAAALPCDSRAGRNKALAGCDSSERAVLSEYPGGWSRPAAEKGRTRRDSHAAAVTRAVPCRARLAAARLDLPAAARGYQARRHLLRRATENCRDHCVDAEGRCETPEKHDRRRLRAAGPRAGGGLAAKACGACNQRSMPLPAAPAGTAAARVGGYRRARAVAENVLTAHWMGVILCHSWSSDGA